MDAHQKKKSACKPSHNFTVVCIYNVNIVLDVRFDLLVNYIFWCASCACAWYHGRIAHEGTAHMQNDRGF